MKKNLILTLAAVCAVSFSGAIAQEKADKKDDDRKPEGRPDAAQVFKAIDANGDGEISMAELAESKRFKDADKKAVAGAFKEKDTNSDGKISGREFARSFGHHHPGKGKGARHPGKGKGKVGDKGGKGGKGGRVDF